MNEFLKTGFGNLTTIHIAGVANVILTTNF